MNNSTPYWLAAAFILFAVVYSHNAKAETYVYAGAWSDHPFSDNDYNERHDLLAVEHKSVMAGYFKNSYGEDSFLAGYRFKRSVGHFEGGLLVGANYGYRDCVKGYADRDRRFCPTVAPMVTYTRYRVQPTVAILGSAVAISVRFEL